MIEINERFLLALPFSACPYISETSLDEAGDCPILILACDGVWDTLSDQEAADLLMERYLVEGPYEQAAELLVSLPARCMFMFISPPQSLVRLPQRLKEAVRTM